jgi:hypothetical protein
LATWRRRRRRCTIAFAVVTHLKMTEDDLTHARDWLNGVANLKLKTDANGLLLLLPAACYFKSQLVKIQTEEKEEKNKK